MKTKTVQQLNKLNKEFYSKTSEFFNNSRQYYWAGWQKILPIINSQFENRKQIKVLDLGCGNGRFGKFLCETLEQKIYYLGIDNSLELLAGVGKNFQNSSQRCTFRTSREDIVAAAIEQSILPNIKPNSQDLVVMFGVWHHIPSKKLCQSLLSKIAKLLKPKGLLIFTAWKFYEYERFKNKIVKPAVAGISSKDLEEHDYILDWQRGTKAFRYCHYSTNEEIETIITGIPELQLMDTFRADGKQENMNQYILLEKNPKERVQ